MTTLSRLFCLCLLLTSVVVHSKPLPTTPVHMGQKFTLKSEIMGEQRPILIKLPRNYEVNTSKRYPVLYTLDGDTHFAHITGTVDWLSQNAARIPQLIVVAIPNTDRVRDMTAGFNDGGGDTFLTMIKQELIPYIDQHYRTEPFRIIAGHSMAGHFALNAFVQEPGLFNAYISMSPFFPQDGDDIKLTDLLAKHLQKNPAKSRFIYTSIGDEKGLLPQYNQFIDALKSTQDKSLRWHSLVSTEDTHMSVPSQTINSALKFIFKPQHLPPQSDTAMQGANAIQSYFKHISEHIYGYPVSAEGSINQLGYHQLLWEKNASKAIDVFKSNTLAYPDSANAYDSLADAYSRHGDYDKALMAIEQAIQLTDKQDRRMQFYQRRKQRILNTQQKHSS